MSRLTSQNAFDAKCEVKGWGGGLTLRNAFDAECASGLMG